MLAQPRGPGHFQPGQIRPVVPHPHLIRFGIPHADRDHRPRAGIRRAVQELRHWPRQQPVDKSPRMGIRPRRDGEPHPPGGCGAPHRMAARIASAIRSALFRGEGGPSPRPSPAALRAASASQPAHEGLFHGLQAASISRTAAPGSPAPKIAAPATTTSAPASRAAATRKAFMPPSTTISSDGFTRSASWRTR